MSYVSGINDQLHGLSLYNKDPGKQDGVDYFSTLPTEILHMIFAYIRPKFLFENLLPVCRRFYSVVNSERWWNLRIQKHPLHSQLCDVETFQKSPLRNWDDIWKEEDAWTNWNQQKRHVTSHGDEEIEVVKLFNNSSNRFCISTSNEHTIVRRTDSHLQLWNLDNRNDNDGLLFETIAHAHSISGIVMCGTDQFISGSLDHCVKLWNIDNASVREISVHSHERMVRSLSYENGLLACLSGPGTLSIHDVQNDLAEIDGLAYKTSRGYSRILLSIVFKGSFVHLAFTDQLVTVDIRMLNAPVQQHTFDDSFADHTVAIKMNWSDGLLQCCNHRGAVQEFEACTLKHRSSFSVANEEECVLYRPNRLVRNRGSTVAITGTVVKAFSLRPRHEHLGTFNQFPDSQYPTAMDALDGNVVVGCSGGSIITFTHND